MRGGGKQVMSTIWNTRENKATGDLLLSEKVFGSFAIAKSELSGVINLKLRGRRNKKHEMKNKEQ